jgi:quercetin dioxygenase-like cupin family protein
MLYSTRLKCAAALLGIAAAGTIGTMASASPGAGVTPETFVTSNLLEDVRINHDRIKFQTKDPTTVRVQKLTFAPGAFTGWHHHPGVVVVAVESGFVTLTDSNCQSKTYGPGSPDGSVFVEGHDEAHEARSMSGATVYVTYVAPSSVFRIEDPAVSCAP